MIAAEQPAPPGAPAAATRPERFAPEPVPPIPQPQGEDEHAATEYSHYRTGLSRHRTSLSEHRTDLSEFRTDLSTDRTEMSMRRSGLSFQRTRLSADRTMMSVIRTSLSLIGFGFTIYQAFASLHSAGVVTDPDMARNFGLVLVILGMIVLVGGIVRDLGFERELRRERAELSGGGLIHGDSRFPMSMNLLVALALFALGAIAIARIAFNISLLT